MSRNIKFEVEEVFRNEDEDERIKKLEELFIKIIKKSEKIEA